MNGVPNGGLASGASPLDYNQMAAQNGHAMMQPHLMTPATVSSGYNPAAAFYQHSPSAMLPPPGHLQYAPPPAGSMPATSATTPTGNGLPPPPHLQHLYAMPPQSQQPLPPPPPRSASSGPQQPQTRASPFAAAAQMPPTHVDAAVMMPHGYMAAGGVRMPLVSPPSSFVFTSELANAAAVDISLGRAQSMSHWYAVRMNAHHAAAHAAHHAAAAAAAHTAAAAAASATSATSTPPTSGAKFARNSPALTGGGRKRKGSQAVGRVGDDRATALSRPPS